MKYDVLVWGASSSTGKLVAEYLFERYGVGRDLAWAIGGRSREKLETVRAALGPAASELPIVIGDGMRPSDLDAIVPETRVVATTVGPYARYGNELVAACARHGVHYCDLTGEVHFMRRSIDRHHDEAKRTGARIVHACGFDSIPSDLGVLLLQEHARKAHGAPCESVRLFVEGMRGGLGGGTAATMVSQFEMMKDPAVRKILLDPYSLSPDARGPDGPDDLDARWDELLPGWTGPWVMGPVNARVVRRSCALLGDRYGKGFSYRESIAFGAGLKGALGATALAVGMKAFFAGLSVDPIRELVRKTILPKPGEGPSRKVRESGYFTLRLVGTGTGFRVEGAVADAIDPGHGSTAKMLGESAICLAKDELPSPGGVLTPASCMGLRLVHRLREAGMTFTASSAAPG